MIRYEFIALAQRLAVERVWHEKVLVVVHGQRPESLNRRELTFVKVHDVFLGGPVEAVSIGIRIADGIDRVFWAVLQGQQP